MNNTNAIYQSRRKGYKPLCHRLCMKNWGWVLSIALLLAGLGAGYYLQPNIPTPFCPAPIVNIPECPVCNPAVVEKPVYLECQDDPDLAEETAEAYEEDTGRKVYDYNTSYSCKEFLEGKGYFNFEKKEVVSYYDNEDGCTVFYSLK